MCCPLMCAAQSEWEAPVTKKNNEAKEVKDTAKKSNKADSKDATLAVKDIKDWKYIQKEQYLKLTARWFSHTTLT